MLLVGIIPTFANSAVPGRVPTTTSSAGTFTPVVPSRLLDTRSGVGARRGSVAPRTAVAVQVAGRGGIPASGISAVVLNVTVLGPTSAGTITAYADRSRRPSVSNLSFTKSQ